MGWNSFPDVLDVKKVAWFLQQSKGVELEYVEVEVEMQTVVVAADDDISEEDW